MSEIPYYIAFYRGYLLALADDLGGPRADKLREIAFWLEKVRPSDDEKVSDIPKPTIEIDELYAQDRLERAAWEACDKGRMMNYGVSRQPCMKCPDRLVQECKVNAFSLVTYILDALVETPK